MKKTLTTLLLSITGLAFAAQDTPASADHIHRSTKTSAATSTCKHCGAVATDQSEKEADRNITRAIRQALNEDTMLSMNAKNIKIITIDGHVTLRGPVASKEEKHIVVAKARQIAGLKNVDNHIDVAY